MNPVFEFSWRNPTHALHLYDYPARMRIGSREIQILPGDMTCIAAGTVYAYESTEPGHHWCIHFYDNPETGAQGVELPLHIHPGANSLFFLEQIRLVSRLHHTHESSQDPVTKLEAQFRLKALLLSILNFSNLSRGGRRAKQNFSWESLISWIDEHLDQSISLPVLAEQANVAPSTLSKKFRETYKTSLSQYTLRRRVDRAKSLLAATPLTVYEVGATVGIPDPQYFNKQFRKVVGVSPSRYRDENQEYLSHVPKELILKEGQWTEPE